jgi:ATP-binding cassette subfamily B protein/subfamily B ATP-binding cassette protein MsbA
MRDEKKTTWLSFFIPHPSSLIPQAAGLRKYGRLLGYAAADWRGWALIAGMSLLSCLAALLQPWPMQVLLDHVLGREPMAPALAWLVRLLPGAGTSHGLLVWVVLAGLAVFALGSGVDVFVARAWVRVGQRMVYRLAADLFSHVQRCSLLFHSRHPVGDSLSRITGDTWCAYKVVDVLVLTPTYALLMAVGIVVLMARVDLGLALVASAAAPLMAGTSFLASRRLRAVARARREIESQIQAHVQQALSGMHVVQAFTQEERELRRFRELGRGALHAHRRVTLASSLCQLGSGLVATLGAAAVLWVGAGHVLNGRLTVGGLLVFLAYLGSLQGQLKAFTGIQATLQEAGASVDRVCKALESDQVVRDRATAQPLPRAAGHLQLHDLTFGYEPGRPVLRGVSLEILPGQTVALIGPSGAGKTTLASLVPRFFDPWQGRLSIDGHDLRDLRLRSLREQVGLVLQEPFLFPLTVAQNIAYGRPDADREAIVAAARAANAHTFIERLPEGYETLLGERGATLSGGERQRLSIARALLRDPALLILDEPTSALDAESEGLLMEALQRLMAGRTTLLIAHRLSTVRWAERIVVLQEGRIVEQGSHPELLARGGYYARIFESQCGPGVRAVSRVEGKL